LYLRTIVVSPSGTPRSKRSRPLAAAISSIVAPSANQRISRSFGKPGVYDLGTAFVSILGYVAIEGSGVEVTRILTSATSTGIFRELETLI